MLHHLLPDEVAPGRWPRTSTTTSRAPRTAARCRPGIHAALFARAGRIDEALAALRIAAEHRRRRPHAGPAPAACTSPRWAASGRRSRTASRDCGPRGDALVVDPRLPDEWSALELASAVSRRADAAPDRTRRHRRDVRCAGRPGRRRAPASRAGRRDADPTRQPKRCIMTILAAIDDSAGGRAGARRRPPDRHAVRDAASRAFTCEQGDSGASAAAIAEPRRSRCTSERRCRRALRAEVGDRDAIALVIGARGLRRASPAGHVALDLVQSLDRPVVVVPPARGRSAVAPRARRGRGRR